MQTGIPAWVEGVTVATAVERLNKQLDGSPYLFPESGDGEAAAKALAKRLNEIGRRNRRLRETLRQQRRVLEEQLPDELAVRRVYESNALEGVGLDLADTYDVVVARHGRSVEEILRDRGVEGSLGAERKLREVEGLDDAYRFADEISQSQPLRLREVDVRNLQGLITTGELHAGDYKQREVQIGGSKHQPTPVIDVPQQMSSLVDWCSSSPSAGVLKACVAHAWLTHIHPFEDGNGRTARVLANIMLACEGYPPLIIRSAEDKGEYLAALSASDEAGNLLQFCDLFSKAIRRGIYELEQPEVARQLLMEDLYGSRQGDFLAWTSLLALFVDRFQEASLATGVQLEVVGSLSPSGFSLLRDYNSSGNGWFIRLRKPPLVNVLVWFGFNSVEYRHAMGAEAPYPSVFFSERNYAPFAEHPYSPLAGSGRFDVDEAVLLPGESKPVAIRRGFDVEQVSLEAGVAHLNAAIRRYERRRDEE